MLAKGTAHRLLLLLNTGRDGIAMAQHGHLHGTGKHSERDRVGRIMARERRVALRIARHFDNPESALAAELRDILAHVPEPVEDDPGAAWTVQPQKGPVDW